MASKKTQIGKFKQAARELETDNSEKRFNEKLGKIAKQKPTKFVKRSKMRKIRSGIAHAIARWLAVPIDVHANFFALGRKDNRTSVCAILPK
jgi:hypothetical protein